MISRMMSTLAGSYKIVPSVATANEGSSVTFTVVTQGLINGTVLYWTNEGNSIATDFSDGVNAGQVTINNDTATIQRTLAEDGLLEGSESLVIALRTGSIYGPIVALAPSVLVYDTSVPMVATGGVITYSGSYKIHTFTVADTFAVGSNPKPLDIFVVAGGGGGGGGYGGTCAGAGGGAGGVIALNGIANATGSYTVLVGASGGGGAQGRRGAQGGDSVFSSYTAVGGGGGGSDTANPTQRTGGSGGSGGGSVYAAAVGSGTTGQGYLGGGGAGCYGYGGGGGGGWQGKGGNNGGSLSNTPGGGGAGGYYGISGSSLPYAYGGAGGTGGATAVTKGANGPANTGYGGGGSDRNCNNYGGNGGSGIVIVRYIV